MITTGTKNSLPVVQKMQKNKIGSKFSCFLFCCKFCWQMHTTQNTCCGNAVLLQKSAQICLCGNVVQVSNCKQLLATQMQIALRYKNILQQLRYQTRRQVFFAQNSGSWCIAVTSLCVLIVILHVVFHFVCLLPNRVLLAIYGIVCTSHVGCRFTRCKTYCLPCGLAGKPSAYNIYNKTSFSTKVQHPRASHP